MQLALSKQKSPVGQLLLVTDADNVLYALDFHDFEPRMRRLLNRFYGQCHLRAGRASSPIRTALRDYFDGDESGLALLQTAGGGTEFQRQVWQAMRTIPWGQTRSYGQLAAGIGRPAAGRAVGLASAANPVAIVVPCHRVIGAGGALTGFGGGLQRKRWLLEHEGAMQTTMTAQSTPSTSCHVRFAKG